ncbi:MAG TPA: hypothetical protein PL182_03840 [Pseudobdellovibrionaceae bacterium]|nr:hypothetical protein [Pseudobdellovibrionaceae bacterium]
MRKKFLFGAGLIGLSAALYWGYVRTYRTSSLDLSSLSSVHLDRLIRNDMLETLTALQSYIENPNEFSLASCSSDIHYLQNLTKKLRPEDMNLSSLKRDHAEIVRRSYFVRQALKNRLNGFAKDLSVARLQSHPCTNAVRNGMRILRYIEDYVLTTVLNPKPFDPAKDKKAGPILNDKAPLLITTDRGPVKLRSGDLILSRGNAYTSAAISRIGVEEAQFSHLAQIYIDAPVGTELTIAEALKDSRVYTVEAHIEIGSFTRSFAKYAEDGNARAAQFRFRGSAENAHKAAKSIFTYVQNHQKKKMKAAHRTRLSVNDNPPYDFKMNGKDHAEIFCAEIVSMGYANAGVKLPTFPTVLKKNELTDRMEIAVPAAFAPADMEIEPHFTQLAEWRDLRKIPSVMKKDVALSSMFRWMAERKYAFQPSTVDMVKAMVAWTGRQTDLGFKERLPKNMNQKIIRLTFAIDRTGALLEEELEKFETAQKLSGRKLRPMFWEQMSYLERFRKEDSVAFKKNPFFRGGSLHGGFRP